MYVRAHLAGPDAAVREVTAGSRRGSGGVWGSTEQVSWGIAVALLASGLEL